ncbi:hypothetical protein ALI144C_16220 [Actinosynnema sp. ALI-1.44]|uniref:hypothetical protein n=1 Tax=Actinosynnema sp. ALI-1.44 TaxID=1933779 RepID=UPI00097C303C|nr:hypothetical protein [Actinosynnema sp. ALI-1.44]ONI84211.1 hypothetical protein ALI144C_16220 [Actinosynnema sp. ALI-1.44]
MIDDLGSPRARRRLLESIHPDSARMHHALLREVLKAEMDHRYARDDWEPAEDDDWDLFENAHLCGFLLHVIGDPADVPLLWETKHIDFDMACGFDIQFLLGAGAESTLAYLRGHGHDDIADDLSEYPELHDDLREWVAWRREYFYGSAR